MHMERKEVASSRIYDYSSPACVEYLLIEKFLLWSSLSFTTTNLANLVSSCFLQPPGKAFQITESGSIGILFINSFAY